MLPTLVHKPFSGKERLFEPKWDGWRATCFIKDGDARFVSRRRNSLSERFPQLKHVTETIKAKTAVLDGEIVALDKDGLPRFDACARGIPARHLSFMLSTCCTWMASI
jgi:ATP-dependent DNA ligase